MGSGHGEKACSAIVAKYLINGEEHIMQKLFGTDGARGVANQELSCEIAMKVGRAAAVILTRHTDKRAKMIIAQDTRISSDMLVSAMAAGICSVGVDVELLGELPTPAVAWLVGKYDADAGVMISASHNPMEFNGIKLFSRTGYKLPDQIEREIERLVLDTPDQIPLASGKGLGTIIHRSSASLDYIDHLKSTVKGDFSGLCVALDCANGSSSSTAALLFSQLGAELHVLHATPTGTNINKNCGSTHMESLRSYMLENQCDVAFAFDGDADRCLALDEQGDLVDGDQILAIVATDLKQRDALLENAIVTTVMSNFGMHQFAAQQDIDLVCTAVGDRYVLEEMLKYGYVIGGEQSGHIIFKNFAQTGDGQLTALQLLNIMKRTGKSMSELAMVMEKLPQVMQGIQADDQAKAQMVRCPTIKKAIRQLQDKMGDTGRVLVRASGTEPLIRVMLEGRDPDVIKQDCAALCEVIEKELRTCQPSS